MSRTPEEYHCADFTKLDGEYEDDGDHKPLECSPDDWFDQQEMTKNAVICASEVIAKNNQEKENPPR